MRAKAGSVVRVMTWNIHGTVGANPRYDLAGVVELIRRWDADIVALQEVDSRRKHESGDNPFDYLQEVLGHHGIGAKSITTDDGDYGQMLMSRWPFVDAARSTTCRFPSASRAAPSGSRSKPRRDRCASSRPISALRIRERRSQARTLLDIAGPRTVTTMVVGDFNDWFWPGSVRSALSRELPGYTRYRTFPSRCPVLRLDRVYCRPGEALIRSYIDARARDCSDHLPIIADVAPHAPSGARGARRPKARASRSARPDTEADRAGS